MSFAVLLSVLGFFATTKSCVCLLPDEIRIGDILICLKLSKILSSGQLVARCAASGTGFRLRLSRAFAAIFAPASPSSRVTASAARSSAFNLPSLDAWRWLALHPHPTDQGGGKRR